MSDPIQPAVRPVRFEEAATLVIAGLREHFKQSTVSDIPALWQRFEPYIGRVPGQVSDFTYGVCFNGDGKGNFDYIAGVEVANIKMLSDKFQHVKLKPQRYAVFEHHGNLDHLKDTFQAIWHDWLPASGEQAAQAPEFERYGKDFDPFDSRSVMEIWLPLEPR
ncbi:GyrI-like domain-containing protein [Pseudomonas sp. NPDC090755]|uniref:GyrI-like domain-containing protein n=1 Tax=Pseudomonas sp. NPDC090755 TaxID=3364481 RepID=UPI00383BC2A3